MNAALEREIDDAAARHDYDRAAELAASYLADGGWRARYLAARVALSAGRLAEARRHLSRLMPPPGPIARRVWLMSAEVLARSGEAGAREHLARAGDCSDDPALHLHEYRIRLWLDDWPGREPTADDPRDQALLMVELGRAQEAKGDLDLAEETWRGAEVYTRPFGDDPIRADALIQLGRVAHLRGDLQAALDHYEAARSPVAAQRTEAMLRRLLVLLDMNQPERVRRELTALVAKDAVDSLAEEVRPVARLLWALLDGGDASAHSSTETAGPVRQARRALATGLAALTCGNAREARPWLDQAVTLAREHSLPEVLWRALQARGQLAADFDGDEKLARKLFEEAVIVSEAQGRTFRHRTDAAAHGLRRADVLRRLLSAACRRGDADATFRWLELERGRLLVELIGASRAGIPIDLGPASEASLIERDRRVDDYLRDRSRVDTAALPRIPDLATLRSLLRPGETLAAPAVAGDEAFLLTATRDAARLVPLGPSAPLAEAVASLRRCLDAQLLAYSAGLTPDRAELDARLSALGEGPLGAAIPAGRVIWVPDDFFHGVPVAALKRGRYLIEDRVIVHTFSASLLAHHRTTRGRRGGRCVVVAESPDVLPDAGREADGVAASFWWPRPCRGALAELRPLLKSAGVLHLACHAYFDPAHPRSACVGLPSGERWHAAAFLDEPLAGLPLVTLSACRSAEVAPLVGREPFGLVTGLLAAGVRCAVAGLWPVADREAVPLMWAFYRHRMTAAVPEALAAAQRDMLSGSPLFWAAFAAFGDPDALPAPRGLFAWIARWRQRRHARRFPTLEVRHVV